MRMVNRVAQDEVSVRRANRDPGETRGLVAEIAL
jgi:hypothetical protein